MVRIFVKLSMKKKLNVCWRYRFDRFETFSLNNNFFKTLSLSVKQKFIIIITHVWNSLQIYRFIKLIKDNLYNEGVYYY